nr:helix-turn-helix domain-containing protein [Paenibacillus phyllosphaerae]
MGVLQLQEGEKQFTLSRYAPSPAAAAFIKHYWIVSWDLTGKPPYLQSVIPNPNVNLVIERGRSGVFAPTTAKFGHLVQGKGCVFGIKFKPGCFFPFINKPVSGLIGEPLPVDKLLGADSRELEEDLLSLPSESLMVDRMEALLAPRLPEPDPQASFLSQLIGQISGDRGITKVEQICERYDMNIRKLQRLFDQYVGVPPKWVIKLYRLQNAAEAIDRGSQPDLLQLAFELGYYDQSHFIKDFKAILGITPDEYMRKGIASH